MSDIQEMHHEVQRRIDYITRRLQSETSSPQAWETERRAMQLLLKRSNRVQGLVIAMELIDKAARSGDTETVKRVAAEALGRTHEVRRST